jgi:hypothetical protein
MSHPGYLVTLGVAVPMVLHHNWRGVENSVRWARSIPVATVQEFMASLPGEPLDPDGQEIIDNHIITRRDDEHMDIVVPIRLRGTDQIWAMTILLDKDPEEELDPGQEPDWLWGLGEQRLMSSEDLRALAIH